MSTAFQEHAFSNKLLPVQLFNGFSRLDFIDLVEKIPFDFKNFAQGSTILKQGQTCTSLYILLTGEVTAVSDSPDHSYRLVEIIRAPEVVQIENLFGLHNRYSATWSAHTDAKFLLLDKQSVRRLLVESPTFQINFYNAVCTRVQNVSSRLWMRNPNRADDIFRSFLHCRCLRPQGEKRLIIRMEDLALELGITRLRVSQMLSRLEEEGKVSHSRGTIVIPALENL